MRNLFIKIHLESGLIDGGFIWKIENTSDSCMKITYQDMNTKFYPLDDITSIEFEIKNYPR